MDYGFTRVCACVPDLRVADVEFNARAIIAAAGAAAAGGAQFVLFPELSVTGYTCADLFLQDLLVDRARQAVGQIARETAGCGAVVIVGLPLRQAGRLYNCAAVIQGGTVRGLVPKTYIPSYKEFYEARWFAPGAFCAERTVRFGADEVPFGTDVLFRAEQTGVSDGAEGGHGAGGEPFLFGVEICEDLWVPVPPSSLQALAGAVLLFNLSASNELIGKAEYRRALAVQQSGRCIAAYAYASAGVQESTTDVVFSGHACIAEYGSLLAETGRFARSTDSVSVDVDIGKLVNERCRQGSFGHGADLRSTGGREWRIVPVGLAAWRGKCFSRRIDPRPFVPAADAERNGRCAEIFAIQTAGLAKRLEHTGARTAVIGISGGLDSTLALLVTAKTFDLLGRDRKGIVAVTMPGFGTTDGTYGNALELMQSLGVDLREISIAEACLRHFADIGHDPTVHDVTYENVQARERTQILMDIANREGGIVIGTGDLSEMALGWSTYNGDHMSMYGVNCSVPKTLVRYLVGWVADNVTAEGTRGVLHRIIDTPISPELLPPDESGRIRQKTEDIIGPYELHDFFLYHHVRCGDAPEKILFLAERAFAGQHDREELRKWLAAFYRRFFSQQFKRSCTPDGPKVGSVSLSPRGDWRMPSDAVAAEWLKRV